MSFYSTLFPAIDISIVLAPLSSTKVYGIPLLISLARAATFPFGSMATTLAPGQPTIEKQHKWDAIPIGKIRMNEEMTSKY